MSVQDPHKNDPYEHDPFGQVKAPPDTGVRGKPRRIKPECGRKKPADLESRTREWCRANGYVYGKCQSLQSVWNPAGGGPSMVSKDVCGFVDGIAVGNGELLLVQTTTRGQKAPHIRKMATGTFKIGNGKETPCIDAVLEILKVPGVRLVLFLWDQPGGPDTRWRLEQVQITHGLISEALGRKRRVA